MSDQLPKVQGDELARLIGRLAELELDRVRHSHAESALDEQMEKLLQTVAGHPSSVASEATQTTKLPSPSELEEILSAAIDELIPMYPPTAAHVQTAEPVQSSVGSVLSQLLKDVSLESTDLDALTEQVLQLISSQRSEADPGSTAITPKAKSLAAAGSLATDTSPVATTAADVKESASTRAALQQEPDLLALAEMVRQDLAEAADVQSATDNPTGLQPTASPAEHHTLQVVDRPKHNFHVAELHLAERAHELWIATFNRLSDNQRTLGWVAFHKGVLAAADHAYDPDFVASLRTYYNATEKLCDKMGTLHAVRFNVDAEEGVMSFVPAEDDMWLMLFANTHTDIEHLLGLIPGVKVVSEYAR